MTLWKVQKLYSENEIRYSVLPYSVKGFIMDLRYIKRWKYKFSFLHDCRLFEKQALRLAKNGSKALLEGSDTLKQGTVDLYDGIQSLYEGTTTLSDGTAEFYDKTYDMDTQVQDQIDEMIDSLSSGESESTEEEEEKGFFQKLKALF